MTAILNARILAALGMIVFVGAIVASGTGAFFSDTETSTGNTFTAGALDLQIDSVSHYNGMVCTNVDDDYFWIPEANVTLDQDNQPVAGTDMDEPTEWTPYNTAHPLQFPEAGTPCTGTWPLADLGDNQLSVGTFFNFNDIKPGDEGENTVSIHIENNDAWMCVSLANVGGSDPIGTATEPEDAEEDALGDIDHGTTLAESELDENLFFFAWADDGDNVYEEGEDNFGAPVSASSLVNQTWALADSTTGNGPIQGDETQYIGVYWCAGEITVNGTNLSCDGEEMGNEAQTDSWNADLVFYIEQARNNEDFVCNPVVQPETATVTVDKIVQFSSTEVLGVDVTDFTLHVVGPSGDVVVTDNVAMPGLLPGAYVVSEVYSNNPGGVQYNASFSGSCTEIGDSGTANMNVVAGVNPTCTITNVVAPLTP